MRCENHSSAIKSRGQSKDYRSVSSVMKEKKKDGNDIVNTVCQYCGQEFNSRNSLFRHLRSNEPCYVKGNADNYMMGNISNYFNSLEKHKVAIQFGYHTSGTDDKNSKINEAAAEIVAKCFFEAVKELYPSFPIAMDKDDTNWSLASAAHFRHPSLSQEKGCSGYLDVLGISYKGGPINGSQSNRNTNNNEINENDRILRKMQETISNIYLTTKQYNDENDAHDELESRLIIEIFKVEYIPVSTKFHAEKSCSQRTYQYLLPIKWLDDTEETRQWLIQKADTIINENSSDDEVRNRHRCRDNSSTPSSITKLKKALKLAQSTDILPLQNVPLNDFTNSDDTVEIASPGRFGKLWQKSRRPWHNFCDPSLGTMANPSNEHIWRTIDKAKLDGFLIYNDEALLIIEISGDGFVPHQVRRIVASAIAMVNGWLPFENYFLMATRPDITIETPIAPSGRLYLSSVRFHFIDLLYGSVLFSCGKKKAIRQQSEDDVHRWLKTLQSQLLQDRISHHEDELSWLREVQHIVAPRVRCHLEKVNINDLTKRNILENKALIDDEDDIFLNNGGFLDIPEVYKDTLSLLKDISKNNNWPVTTGSRSIIFRSLKQLNDEKNKNQSHKKHQTRAIFSQFDGHLVQCGCFTVVNPELFQGKIPLGNKLFPELVDSIFKLEAGLKSKNVCNFSHEPTVGKHKYPGSTHCTVNRNIQYTPHVKNGNGRTDTYSMIVGLGDYSGGRMVLDNEVHDIRYNALKYNGWKQIHSTESFQGERFTLEWYTPDMRREYDCVDGNTKLSFEDIRADNLVDIHTRRLPSYSVLKYRKNSTDALVINEILNTDKGCCYEIDFKLMSAITKSSVNNFKSGFSLKEHDYVLDIGAHIGVFSRYALSMGCQNIIAFEPEKENFELLCENLDFSETINGCNKEKIKIHNCAVANGNPGVKNFIKARNRNDGSLNTWRHTLEEYSQYVDKKASTVLSEGQKAILDRSEVPTVPLFGEFGALKPGVTFVKIDCEGAEIDLLLSHESAQKSNWLNVTHLVFEWSFTKERRIQKFHKAVNNLESAGFTVAFEGQGSWWDTPESNCMWWPYHTDLVVFAFR